MGLREEKKDATQRRIREAAWALFEERGYDAVTVEEIAAEAGVSRTTFFNYFHTKEGVVLDPSPDDRALLDDLVAAQPAGRSAWDAVVAVLLGLTRGSADAAVRRRTLAADDPALARRAREIGEELAAILRSWLRETRPGDPLGTDLAVDLALAAAGTAWAACPCEAGPRAYLALVEECLSRARPAGLGLPGAAPGPEMRTGDAPAR